MGGLTDVDGVMGNIGDELLWWFDVLKAPNPLLTALLLLLWLLVDELLLLFALPEDASVGVCFMWDDLLPEFPLVELVVVLVVLLFDDDDVVFELLEFLVAVDEPPDGFELLILEDAAADVECCNCWRHLARRFLNQTWGAEKRENWVSELSELFSPTQIESSPIDRSQKTFLSTPDRVGKKV